MVDRQLVYKSKLMTIMFRLNDCKTFRSIIEMQIIAASK